MQAVPWDQTVPLAYETDTEPESGMNQSTLTSLKKRLLHDNATFHVIVMHKQCN